MVSALATSMAGNKGKKSKARSFKRPKSFEAAPVVLGMGPNGGIHDAEPTRNVKEMHFTIFDWFTVKLPEVPTAGNFPDFVYSYGIEESQNFLGQVTDVVAEDQGRGVTKNRIKSVSLDVLSPEGSVQVGVGNLTKAIDLPLVVSAVPVPTSEQDSASSPGPNALIGQNSTVVHPDVRRAWVRVGHWNWRTLFSDTQLQPFYSQYDSSVKPSRNGIGLELVRLGLYNSVDGNILFSPANAAVEFQFRIAIEMAAPVGLTPTPRRFNGRVKNFAGEANNEVVSGVVDLTPVQYQIQGVQNLM